MQNCRLLVPFEICVNAEESPPFKFMFLLLKAITAGYRGLEAGTMV
jgi:hypothetical protein